MIDTGIITPCTPLALQDLQILCKYLDFPESRVQQVLDVQLLHEVTDLSAVMASRSGGAEAAASSRPIGLGALLAKHGFPHPTKGKVKALMAQDAELWATRPLPGLLKQYAADDARHLVPVATKQLGVQSLRIDSGDAPSDKLVADAIAYCLSRRKTDSSNSIPQQDSAIRQQSFSVKGSSVPVSGPLSGSFMLEHDSLFKPLLTPCSHLQADVGVRRPHLPITTSEVYSLIVVLPTRYGVGQKGGIMSSGR